MTVLKNNYFKFFVWKVDFFKNHIFWITSKLSLTKLSNNYIPFSDDSSAVDSIIYCVFFFQLFSSSYLNLFHVFWKNFRLFDFSKIHASWKESTLFWLALLFSVWHFFQQKKSKCLEKPPCKTKIKKEYYFPTLIYLLW